MNKNRLLWATALLVAVIGLAVNARASLDLVGVFIKMTGNVPGNAVTISSGNIVADAGSAPFLTVNSLSECSANSACKLNIGAQPAIFYDFSAGLSSGFSFARASSAFEFGRATTPALTTFGSGSATAPAQDFSNGTVYGLGIWGARTNALRNGTFTGGASGVPGTLPTNVSGPTTLGGVGRSIVGFPTVQGMACMDIKFSTALGDGGSGTGTTASSWTDFYTFEGSNVIADANNQVNSNWVFAAVVGGSLANMDILKWVQGTYNNTPSLLGRSSGVDLTTLTSTLTQKTENRIENQSTAAYINPQLTIGWTSAVGTGKPINTTLRFCNAELETSASVASPPLPTSGSAVSRNADVVTHPFGYYPNGFTVAVKATIPQSGTAGESARCPLSISDGTTNNRLEMCKTPNVTTFPLTVANGGVATSIGTASVTPGTSFTYAFGLDASGNYGFSFNQANEVTGSTNAPSLKDLTTIKMGANADGTASFNGYDASMFLWPFGRLTGNDLKTLQARLP